MKATIVVIWLLAAVFVTLVLPVLVVWNGVTLGLDGWSILPAIGLGVLFISFSKVATSVKWIVAAYYVVGMSIGLAMFLVIATCAQGRGCL